VLGACIVVGHNVIHLLPNEVPILFVAFWISTRVRCGTWKPAALQRPQSWWKTALMALVAALVLQVGSELLVQPLASHFWPRPARVSSLLEAEAMGWPRALATLAVVWGFAAFGEEIGYRGYLLERIAHLGNRSRLAYVAAVALVAVLFGFGHFYKATRELPASPIPPIPGWCSAGSISFPAATCGRPSWRTASATPSQSPRSSSASPIEHRHALHWDFVFAVGAFIG